MRRYLWIILFFVVLLTPFVLRAFVGEGGEARDAATPEPQGKSLRIVVLTANAEPIRSEFADAFSRWHQEKFAQPVFVDYRVYGGATIDPPSARGRTRISRPCPSGHALDA